MACMVIGSHPSTRRIVVASYSSAIALKHAMDTRALIQSEWYSQIFPTLKLAKDQNQKSKFMTNQRGFRLSTSVGGTLTGEGGEFMIVDDPHNASQVASPVMRQRAIDWFQHTFLTRQDNLEKGCYVVVMQRLHAEDLSGHLLAKQGWEHLIIPAICPATQTYHFQNYTYVRTVGELLNPARDSESAFEKLKADIGSHAFAAQYQQEPLLAQGRLIHPEWLQYTTQPPTEGMRVQSWDTAIKAGTEHDLSVGQTWRITPKCYILEDMIAGTMEYPALKNAIVGQAEKYQPQAILIEDKASGQSLIQELKNSTHLPIVAIQPKGDKIQRLLRVLGQFEAGKIVLPRGVHWLADYERELFAFPESKHDDRVDATTQFLNWAITKERQESAWKIRML